MESIFQPWFSSFLELLDQSELFKPCPKKGYLLHMCVTIEHIWTQWPISDGVCFTQLGDAWRLTSLAHGRSAAVLRFSWGFHWVPWVSLTWGLFYIGFQGKKTWFQACRILCHVHHVPLDCWGGFPWGERWVCRSGLVEIGWTSLRHLDHLELGNSWTNFSPQVVVSIVFKGKEQGGAQ